MISPSFAVVSCLGAAFAISPVVSLDLSGALGHSGLPKSVEGIALAFARPKLAQKAVFFYSATNTLQASLVSVVIHWRDNVLVFVRTRQPSTGWGALFRLFLCSIPKFVEVTMSSLSFPHWSYFLPCPAEWAACFALPAAFSILYRLAPALARPAGKGGGVMKNNTLRSFNDNRPSNSLYEAHCIALFLQDSVVDLCMGNGGGSIGDDSAVGLGLVFDMLHDKLSIARGELVLPEPKGGEHD